MKEQVINEFKQWLQDEGLPITNILAKIVIAIYIRVSTNKQEELSPISQLKAVYKYAMSHNMQIDLNYIFIEEEGVSGKSAKKRKEFNLMIGHAKVEDHPFDAIVVWKFSRFARNQEESIVYKSLLKKNNVDVISATENVSDEALGPFASLIERIIEWMDEYYIIRLSGEVMRGMTEGAAEGKYQTNAPFGYKWIGDKNNRELVIEPAEAEIVKLIYEKFTKDEMTMMDIARYINDLGIKTKRGGKFDNRGISYILLNPVYKGYSRWTPDGKLTRDELYNNTRSIIEQGKLEPIINEDICELARKKLEKYRTFRKPHQVDSSNPWSWVKGLVRCSCGKTFIRTDGKLRCNGYNKGACTINDKLDIEEVKGLILEEIKAYINNPINIKVEKKVKIGNTNERNIILNQLELLEKKEKRIKDAYVNGIDNLEEYQYNKKELLKEREILQQKLNNTDEPTEKKDPTIIQENLKQVYDILTDESIEMKKKFDIAHELIDRVIYEDGNLTLIFNEIK